MGLLLPSVHALSNRAALKNLSSTDLAENFYQNDCQTPNKTSDVSLHYLVKS